MEVQLRQALEAGRLEDAIAHAERLIAFDPIHLEARRAMRQAERELSFRAAYDQAVALFESGREEEALGRLFAIPPGGPTHARARLLAGRIAKDVAGRARADCLGFSRMGHLREAEDRCRIHLDLSCHQQVDESIVETLRWVEARLRPVKPWSCPAERIAWWGETTKEEERAPVAGEIDGRAAAAIDRWMAGGQAEVALEALRKSDADALAPWIDAIRISEARLREGQSALLAGRLDEAEAALADAARAEAAVLPEGARSTRLRDAFRSLAQAWLVEGQGFAERRQWDEAARAFRRGLAADPHSFELQQALRRLPPPSHD